MDDSKMLDDFCLFNGMNMTPEILRKCYEGVAKSSLSMYERTHFTKEDLTKLVEDMDILMHPYLLIGTKESIDSLEGIPDEFKLVYVPDGYMADGYEDKVIMIKRQKPNIGTTFYYPFVENPNDC